MILEVTDVEKNYGVSHVLNRCTFKLGEGEIYGLLGVNGAGKTTLMKMILGLQEIDRGMIQVLGNSIIGNYKYLSYIGSMIEVPFFYEHLSARENLEMHLSYMKKEGDISQTLRLVGLEESNPKPVAQYSLGMRQRLGLARAVIHKPKLLILDEPLNGLDPIGIAEMREFLHRLAHNGMTILLSSHILEETSHTADRIGILAGGCIAHEFSVKEVMSEQGNNFENYIINIMRRNDNGLL